MFRYGDNDPLFDDGKGNMWSEWLLLLYLKLNLLDSRTKEQNNDIDLMYNASFQGRNKLNEVEKIMKKKYGEKINF